jgi:beta-glucosidase
VAPVADTEHFPEGFRWGVALAAHQVDGSNWNTDWWEFEHTPGSGCSEPSGDACDSWHRWEQDLEITAQLGFGNFRFSVEWARVEPEEGEFSTAALDHYRSMCHAMHQRGLEPVVTLHHFTNPRWVARTGGWENPETPARFERFCEHTLGVLGSEVGRICTVNEPNIVATMGYLLGLFPPGRTEDGAAYEAVVRHLVSAHRRAVEVARSAAPAVPVGLTLSMTDYQLAPGGELKLAEAVQGEDVFLDATGGDDFLGVQTYTRMLMGPQGWIGPQPGVPILTMGYEYWPDALEACIRRAVGRTGGRLPIIVTENGIGTDDDQQRMAFVHQALQGVLRLVADGIDVLGYTYWSLLDNFEWAMGYRPHFGLVDVDRSTFARRVKDSGKWLGSVAQGNVLHPPPGGAAEA